MNLVLADTEEFRRIRQKGAKAANTQIESDQKRTLGLTIVRGTNIVSLSVESPPPADPSARLGTTNTGTGAPTTLSAGPGISRPAGRGALPIGLTGPAMGVGGPPPPGGFPGFGGGPPGGFPGAPGRGAPGKSIASITLIEQFKPVIIHI
jgi:hypothetical protein